MVAGAFTGHLLALGLKPVELVMSPLTVIQKESSMTLSTSVTMYPTRKSWSCRIYLSFGMTSETIEKLSKIAPTVAVEYGIPLREQLMDFGKMTGREEQAKA